MAGLINGKNIWKNNYARTLSVLDTLKAKNIDVVLSTSCSLLHVPYTLENETKLSPDIAAHFAFANEKLEEAAQLKKLADCDDYKNDEAFVKNQKLFNEKRDCR